MFYLKQLMFVEPLVFNYTLCFEKGQKYEDLLPDLKVFQEGDKMDRK